MGPGMLISEQAQSPDLVPITMRNKLAYSNQVFLQVYKYCLHILLKNQFP